MARHIGPIDKVRNLRDWSAVAPPAPGWVLDRQILDSYGFLVVNDGRRPFLAMFTTFAFAEAARREALSVHGSVAVESLEAVRDLADAEDRDADVRDNTRHCLAVINRRTQEELRRVDVTGKPEELAARVRENLRRAYCIGTENDVVDVTNVFGQDLPAEDAAAPDGLRAGM